MVCCGCSVLDAFGFVDVYFLVAFGFGGYCVRLVCVVGLWCICCALMAWGGSSGEIGMLLVFLDLTWCWHCFWLVCLFWSLLLLRV